MSALTTELPEVLAVLAALRRAGCRCWVAGGWGVDALAGRVTRPHRDLDLAVARPGLGAGLASLGGLGYAMETDWLPVRAELHRPGRGWVDLHPVVFDADGHGRQAGLDGAVFHYPASGFAQGWLGGTVVDCLSREQQLAFHRGYEPRDVDRHDLAVLQALEGVSYDDP